MNIGDPAYWETRYQTELAKLVTFQLFDWYCPSTSIFPLIETLFDNSHLSQKILVIGIGRSDVIDYLYRKGYRDITGIDISPTVIFEMRKKYESLIGVELFVMDTRQLIKFVDNTFTMVFDKACIDALFCGTDYMDSVLQVFDHYLSSLY